MTRTFIAERPLTKSSRKGLQRQSCDLYFGLISVNWSSTFAERWEFRRSQFRLVRARKNAMATVSENVRKITTFLLAVILWLHAFFFLNFQSTLFSKSTQLIRLTFSEIVLLVLLIVFSFVAGSS